MVVIYLIAAMIINYTEKTTQVIEGINTIIQNDLSGTAIFWWGLLIVVILDSVVVSN